MQVTQTLAEGLKREFRITVPAADLDGRVASRLDELKTQVRINGFRPGKVPVAHLKRVYGKAVFSEVLQAIMADANQQIIDENKLKLATPPQYKGLETEAEFDKVAAGSADLIYTVGFEVLPEITVGDLKSVSIEKPVAEVSDAQVDEELARIAKQNASYEPKGEDAAAENGDRVIMDYDGKVDGASFEGGTGSDIPVDLGSNTFIPGFEEQLVGVKAGDTREVKATFPTNYMRQDLAGKEGVFQVTVKGVEKAVEKPVDEEFAKSLGLESLDKLKDAVREQIVRQYDAASRQRMKRQLLDALDATHKFDLPPSLVEQEFTAIWNQVERDLAESKEEATDETKAEYRTIAERRVRLGLLLAEIGEQADIKVTDDEVTRAVIERARQFPGREQQVWEYYRKNPEALAEIRAPIFEEKVVDHIAGIANVTEKKVTRDELFAEPEEDAAKA